MKLLYHRHGSIWEMLNAVSDDSILLRKPNDIERKHFRDSYYIFQKQHNLSRLFIHKDWGASVPFVNQTDEEYLDEVLGKIFFKEYFTMHVRALKYYSKKIVSETDLGDVISKKYHLNKQETAELIDQCLYSSNFLISFNKHFDASIEASLSDTRIYLATGLVDLIAENATLATAYSTSVVGDVLTPLKRDGNTNKLKLALSNLSAMFDFIRYGKQSQALRFQLHEEQEMIRSSLYYGGLFFVMFHEYTHILIHKLLVSCQS